MEYCTGTWCNYCPCGHRIIEQIETIMPNAIFLGYHGPTTSSDPWRIFPGNAIQGLLSFIAAPTGVIDRTGPAVSREVWQSMMIARNDVPATVSINVNGVYIRNTRKLNLGINATALEELTGSYKMNIVILEDSLIYSQAGYSGCPGGTQYVHNHVVRSMINGAEGELLIADSWNAGQTITKNLDYTVPVNFVPANCRLVVFVYKVQSPLNQARVQQAEQFSITGFPDQSVFVTSPNGGESLLAGSNFNITWNSEDVDSVRIDYSTDAGLSWMPIMDSYYNTGSFPWQVPAQTLSDCKVMVSHKNNPFNCDASNSTFTIDLMHFNVHEQWNMVSVPLLANDMSPSVIFPHAVSEAFRYNDGYEIADTLQNGTGYWIMFDSSETIGIPGLELSDDSIRVQSGWNLIGPFDKTIEVDSISTTPPGILSSFFYNYELGYTIANQLNRGNGYWIKSNSEGLIHFNSSVNSVLYKNTEINSEWARVEISDATGSKVILYLNEDSDKEKFMLPPMPPAGIFDIRFSSNGLLESLDDGMKVINISGAVYPLRIKVKGLNLNIRDVADGLLLDEIINDGDEYLLSDARITKLIIQGSYVENLLLSYSLKQNFPNPFNPSTVISFSVPEEIFVNLQIYNALGQSIFVLKNEILKPGVHDVTFDASSLASGVYFYTIHAGDFIQTKKMLLIK